MSDQWLVMHFRFFLSSDIDGRYHILFVPLVDEVKVEQNRVMYDGQDERERKY
jgi:hypothetical protein